MHCVGVDLIEVARVEKAIQRWGDRFLQRIYTGNELRLCRQKPWRLAGRFAGKEAVMKAMGTGIRGISWREIEILAEPSGRPNVNLIGKALAKANEMNISKLAISLSDTREHAIAFVVGEISTDNN